MMNVFSLLGTIAINADSAHKAIDGTTKKAEKASGKMNKAFSAIGSSAVHAGKMIASGMAVGAAALGALFKLSLGEYAEYEQLVGGVETLFKDSKDKVMQYANEAYKTAGLSANDYLSTVTSFSASLLQGLGGDTEEAAELANMAVTDMADNANKMGTAMSSVQDAYHGFAKQNYTMLDNLKLGYGGTQAEMARLINDSGVLGDAITVTAETVNQVSFDKIIEAIHIVQTEMGITGTTAEEAATTISGSFATFKAAWSNLLTGILDKDADMKVLFDNLVVAGETVMGNVLALLPTFKENVGALLGEVGLYIQEKMNDTVLPAFNGLIDVDWLTENVGKPVENFRTSVIEPIAGYWTDTVFPAIKSAITAVDDFLGLGLVDGWDSITTAVSQAWDNVASSIQNATAAIQTYLGLEGNTGLGGGDARPWYVRENPGKYTNQADGSHANGLNYVPFDGYRAILHKGESVLTSQEASMWRNGGSSLASTMRNAMAGIQFNVVLDSGVLVGQLAPKMDMKLGAIGVRKGRGN